MFSRLPAARWRALAALLAVLAGPALAEPVPEPDLKAAFVYNFTVFTEWPQDALGAGAPIRICASLGSTLAAALGQLNDKLVNGHRISVRPTPAAARNCHVLVLGVQDRERWVQLRHELAGASVLTVADDPDIGADGAVIAMSVENLRIGFAVDLVAARGARLTLSSKLLRLARSVQ